jgi:hypothetical protein
MLTTGHLKKVSACRASDGSHVPSARCEAIGLGRGPPCPFCGTRVPLVCILSGRNLESIELTREIVHTGPNDSSASGLLKSPP